MILSSQQARLVWYRERVRGEWVSANRGDCVGCPEGGGNGSELGEGEKDQTSFGESGRRYPEGLRCDAGFGGPARRSFLLPGES